MGSRSYKVSVPGSLMLLGEHAVLFGKHAVVAAIDRRIKISLIPRQDDKIKIVSLGFDDYFAKLKNFKIIKQYSYILTSIKHYLPKIKQGFTLKIQADFPSDIGFGSSAAVTVATIAVLYQWIFQKRIILDKLYRQAFLVVQKVQGCGSGADVAASVFGGVIKYKNRPFMTKKLGSTLPLVAVYSGNKISTAKVINKVEASYKKFPKIFQDIYKAMDSCAKVGALAIKNKKWTQLGELMNLHQGLHEAIGVSNSTLSEIVSALRDNKDIFGAKISGSGLGDSVIGLGKIKKNSFPENKLQRKKGIKQMDVKVSSKGLVYL